MGRPKDSDYWNKVTKEENGRLKCKQCGKKFKGGVSRIKAHVDRIQGKGIRICSSSSNNSQYATNDITTWLADLGSYEMIDIVGSSSINHVNNTQPEPLLAGWGAEDGVTVNGSSNVCGPSQSEINQLISDLTSEEDDINKQLQSLESRGKKRNSNVGCWLNELQDLKKRAVDIQNSWSSTDLDALKPYIEELTDEVEDHKLDKPLVLSNEFVGEQFEENVRKIWSLLEDDRVFIIGLRGMGGVGKTFLATFVENEIKRRRIFKHVFWVTVSHDFTILKLRHDIAETIGVKLYGDDERTRAAILTSELEKREKTLLFLDDVWKYIDLQKVGIPLKQNGIKLIITTRMKHLCQQMDCLPENTITMYPFDEDKEEAWELFLLKLGHHGTPATIPPEVEHIAKSIVMKCDGLPLGIDVMARTMKRGGNDIHRWRDALNKLNKLEMREEMKEEVLTVLKRSYDYLNEKDVQKCFLYCAMLPCHRTYYKEEDLVAMLVKNGLLNGKRSLEEIFDERHVMLNNLIEQSLLELEVEYWIGMHGMVRNMACYTLKQSDVNVMVKCGQYLTKIPHVREWAVDLQAVSLANNSIKGIPKGISPNCPCLSTLILSHNRITDIPECFFMHMNALTLLDLSHNDELRSLPNSLSNLRSLTSLLLRGCSELEFIPPLGELQALSTLDISGCCSILQAPQGLQNLINLKWLDMCQCWNSTLTQLPGCVLASLTNMQYLDLRGRSGIKAEDVKGMTMLECFAGSFLDQDDYSRYVRQIQDGGYGPQTYDIHFGKFKNATPHVYLDPIYCEFKRRRVWFGDCDELPYLLPRDLTELSVSHNNQSECLCDSMSSNWYSSLKKISISDCTKLKSVFCLCCAICTNNIHHNLQYLELRGLECLTAICKEDADFTQSLSSTGVFSHLMHFEIEECHEIKTLLTSRLVAQLQNLESITVSSCHSMEKIFDDDGDHGITLPKLTKLNLWRLPVLKTVCKGTLFCGSEYILSINGCPNREELRRNTTVRRV